MSQQNEKDGEPLSVTLYSEAFGVEDHVMESNLAGRVGKYRTQASGWLLPVFEAISNSIYGIEEAGRVDDGFIEVILVRHHTMLAAADRSLQSINSVLIRDNGSGFTSSNLAAFNELDSDLSLSRGRKGEGRLSWLAYFNKTLVRSRFQESGRFQSLSFEYAVAHNGVSQPIVEPLDQSTLSTEVELHGLIPKCWRQSQKSEEAIGLEIIQHFFVDFLSNRIPRILIRDEDQSNGLDLSHLFKMEFKSGPHQSVCFEFGSRRFQMDHLLVANTGRKKGQHRVHWCGQRRSVKSKSLDTLPFLSTGALPDKMGVESIYIGVLQSDYLDEHLDEKRLQFLLPEAGDLVGLEEGLTEKDLHAEVMAVVSAFLEPYLSVARDRSWQTLRDYVDHEAPEYRLMLTNPAYTEELSWQNFVGMSPHDIETFLHRIEWRKRSSIKRETKKLVHAGLESEESLLSKVDQLMASIREVNQIDLSRFVVSRKVTLDVFSQLLNRQENGAFCKEARIHDLVFPMRSRSDSLGAGEHNLWLLDERLTFHTLLSSDLPLSRVIEEGGSKRPDLLVFQSRYITREGEQGDPLHSATIIEFKRPGRDDFWKDDPIAQIIQYATQIKEGTIRDSATGRVIKLDAGSPVYAYLIADIGPSLQVNLVSRGFFRTPGTSEGYYWFNGILGVYIEVLSFDKMYANAKQRNRPFFKKLGLV